MIIERLSTDIKAMWIKYMKLLGFIYWSDFKVLLFLENSLLQKLHVIGFFPSRTTSMCEFKAHFFIKSAPHLSHLNGFWRVCFLHELLQCVTLNYFPIKPASHLNGFCPSWTKSRLLFDPKLSTQILHLKGFLPSWIAVTCRFRCTFW